MYKIVLMVLFVFGLNSILLAQDSDQLNNSNHSGAKDTLVVLWSSGDPAVAEKVCLMYTHAAYKYAWFEKVTLIVWGPSANLLANNPQLQKKIKAMISDGIQVEACVVCADSYGVSDKLRDMGIKVYGMGKPLTNYLKSDYSILTF
jgi:hypothetical protein